MDDDVYLPTVHWRKEVWFEGGAKEMLVSQVVHTSGTRTGKRL